MTVAELIAELLKLPQDALVVKSKDLYENDFDTVDDVEMGAYDRRDREWGRTVITKKMRALGYTDEDIHKGVPAVCLW